MTYYCFHIWSQVCCCLRFLFLCLLLISQILLINSGFFTLSFQLSSLLMALLPNLNMRFILMWPCVVDRTLKSTNSLTHSCLARFWRRKTLQMNELCCSISALMTEEHSKKSIRMYYCNYCKYPMRHREKDLGKSPPKCPHDSQPGTTQEKDQTIL